ncbi:hypothetical protein EVAR_260_1 [Eumeta japonica]|uniref:Uncharacterized protein n=1 Tax=Eumeta variegata TaxID=151549 RepID=A0A4C1S9E6_EUMVA|nr:hypothetical protein EVAR_260_1 [Eumeta japonica]
MCGDKEASKESSVTNDTSKVKPDGFNQLRSADRDLSLALLTSQRLRSATEYVDVEQQNSVPADDTGRTRKGAQLIMRSEAAYVVFAQSNRLIKLVAISMEEKVDIAKVLTFPLTPVPLSMFQIDNRNMHKTDKAVLMKALERTVDEYAEPDTHGESSDEDEENELEYVGNFGSDDV